MEITLFFLYPHRKVWMLEDEEDMKCTKPEASLQKILALTRCIILHIIQYLNNSVLTDTLRNRKFSPRWKMQHKIKIPMLSSLAVSQITRMYVQSSLFIPPKYYLNSILKSHSIAKTESLIHSMYKKHYI